MCLTSFQPATANASKDRSPPNFSTLKLGTHALINLSKIIIVRGLIIIHIHKTVNQEVLENFSSKTLLRRFQKQAKFPNEQSKIFFY